MFRKAAAERAGGRRLCSLATVLPQAAACRLPRPDCTAKCASADVAHAPAPEPVVAPPALWVGALVRLAQLAAVACRLLARFLQQQGSLGGQVVGCWLDGPQLHQGFTAQPWLCPAVPKPLAQTDVGGGRCTQHAACIHIPNRLSHLLSLVHVRRRSFQLLNPPLEIFQQGGVVHKRRHGRQPLGLLNRLGSQAADLLRLRVGRLHSRGGAARVGQGVLSSKAEVRSSACLEEGGSRWQAGQDKRLASTTRSGPAKGSLQAGYTPDGVHVPTAGLTSGGKRRWSSRCARVEMAAARMDSTSASGGCINGRVAVHQ